MRWKYLSFKKKQEIVISILEESGELFTEEIQKHIKERGVEPPSKHQLALWLRQFMLYKYLKRELKPHPVYGSAKPLSAWKLRG
jgi:hypothetical protein